MSQQPFRTRISQDWLEKLYGTACSEGLFLTSPMTIKMSSIPYFALDILRAIKRKITAMIDMLKTTKMDAAASVHRLSLSEGTALTHSWGIIARAAVFQNPVKKLFQMNIDNWSESLWESSSYEGLPHSWRMKMKKKSFNYLQCLEEDRLWWGGFPGASRWNQTDIQYKRSQNWDHKLSHWRRRRQVFA